MLTMVLNFGAIMASSCNMLSEKNCSKRSGSHQTNRHTQTVPFLPGCTSRYFRIWKLRRVRFKENNTISPPHATSGSGNFSLAKAAPGEKGPGKYRLPDTAAKSTSLEGSHHGPPGSHFVSPSKGKSAAKNARKRAAARAKKNSGP